MAGRGRVREGKSEGEEKGRGRGRVRELLRKRAYSQPILQWTLIGLKCKTSHLTVSCGYDSGAEGKNYPYPSQNLNETDVQLTTAS